MGYRVARKHAAKLRLVAALGGAGLPVLASLVALALPLPLLAMLLALMALAGAMAGALVERWLFFAEARHTVTLYYGAQAA
jgi:DMSO reductase anchor subunit